MNKPANKKIAGVGGLVCGVLAAATHSVAAEEEVYDNLFGESFVVRDLSDDLFEATRSPVQVVTREDSRGVVHEWQFSKGKRVIEREVWSDDNGGVFSIGRRL